MNERDNQSYETQQNYTFALNPAALPPALRQRVLKQYFGAALVALFAILSMIIMQSWEFAIGFLISVYLVWLGSNMIRKWQQGKIVCKRVMCLKAQKIPLMKNKLIVVLKDLDAAAGDEKGVYNFYVPTSSRAAAQFSEKIVLHIYIEAENPVELLAWQAIDVTE